MVTSMSSNASSWHPLSWRNHPVHQSVTYDDPAELEAAAKRIAAMPPIVTSWEVERLKGLLADVGDGKRFLLQGGDCAETLKDCTSNAITGKLKILLQMSLVLVHGGRKPVVRVGRFAGQYAKPRSSPTETRDGVTLPSYFGDLVNRVEFNAVARRPDPNALVDGYTHAALTMNFVRSLTAAGFADLHHPEYWDLGFLKRGELPAHVRAEYTKMTEQISASLEFIEALGEQPAHELSRVEFYASHEGLHLEYESAQTRAVPRRPGYYDLTTHLPWIGERTRQLDGAHIEYFRGINNPVGVKVGPKTSPGDLVKLTEVLNPQNERGKLVIIARLGAKHVGTALAPLVEGVTRAKRNVVWSTDPMHGNGQTLPSGIKTRSFDDICEEIEQSFEIHARMGTHLGGVHFELTGDDVTECIGGGLTEADLDRAYETLCDPRLNYAQALELAFLVSNRMKQRP